MLLLVFDPRDLYPPISLSQLYNIITLKLEKTKQEGCVGLSAAALSGGYPLFFAAARCIPAAHWLFLRGE
jgi:hypothetical protein